MTRVYKYWTKKDIDILITAIDKSPRQYGRINWDIVTAMVPGRNRQQCKSFYTNKLRKASTEIQRTYHIWSEEDEHILLNQVKATNQGWQTIQQKFFPNLTIKQLQTKYKYLCKQNTIEQPKIENNNKDDEIVMLVRQLLSDCKTEVTTTPFEMSCDNNTQNNTPQHQLPTVPEIPLEVKQLQLDPIKTILGLEL